MAWTVEIMVGLLALVCIALSSGVVDGGRSIQPLETEDIQVEKKLKLLNNPFVKSIQSEDGDVIDCVDINKQPAFDHPLLKNHTIKVPPSFPTKGDTSASSIMNSSLPFSQVWRKSGSCPNGTIPIRRVLRQHLNASSLERYGKKPMNIITKRDFHILDYTFALGIEHYHTTAALITSGFSYTGAKAYINVWNPPVEADDECTSGQMTLTSGQYDNSDSIEVGWMVNPSVYGDRRTRFFIYWTNDSGKSTGCFDLLCSGFVQVNKDILLGGAIETISSYHGQQYVVPVEVVKDFNQEVWWLITSTGTDDIITVGYWPCDMFISMYHIAEMVMWGGDVYSPRMHTGRHTATAMGSGHFSSEHWSMASHIKHPRMRDYSMTYKCTEDLVIASRLHLYVLYILLKMLLPNFMIKKEMAILLALLYIASSIGLVVGKQSNPFPGEELQVEDKLRLLNKPFVKSIQSEDGDIIDCVDLYKQPALDHPLLKNHSIRISPSFDPTKGDSSAPSILNYSLPFSQVWRRSGSCPEGTIPIRRVLKHHLLNASSLERYGKKNTNVITKRDFRMLEHTFAVGIEHYHTAAALITAGYSYTGATADINVWNPRVEADDEYSTAQIWLRNGPFNNSDTIEFGWMVNPSVYGDRQTRLFIYWTNDSGKSTGCFDLLCPGFVQVNKDILLGGTIYPTSAFHGQQHHISLEVVRDFDQNVWWLISTADNIIIGYWPCDIFSYLYNIAVIVEWGGDVYSPRMHQELHTTTAMGSGNFASDHWSFACFIHQPRIRDYSMTYKYPYPSSPFTPDVNCYSGENYAEVLFTEPLFYFGGPGRNLYCP